MHAAPKNKSAFERGRAAGRHIPAAVDETARRHHFIQLPPPEHHYFQRQEADLLVFLQQAGCHLEEKNPVSQHRALDPGIWLPAKPKMRHNRLIPIHAQPRFTPRTTATRTYSCTTSSEKNLTSSCNLTSSTFQAFCSSSLSQSTTKIPSFPATGAQIFRFSRKE